MKIEKPSTVHVNPTRDDLATYQKMVSRNIADFIQSAMANGIHDPKMIPIVDHETTKTTGTTKFTINGNVIPVYTTSAEVIIGAGTPYQLLVPFDSEITDIPKLRRDIISIYTTLIKKKLMRPDIATLNSLTKRLVSLKFAEDNESVDQMRDILDQMKKTIDDIDSLLLTHNG